MSARNDLLMLIFYNILYISRFVLLNKRGEFYEKIDVFSDFFFNFR